MITNSLHLAAFHTSTALADRRLHACILSGDCRYQQMRDGRGKLLSYCRGKASKCGEEEGVRGAAGVHAGKRAGSKDLRSTTYLYIAAGRKKRANYN